jgi:predicted DNA-binding transcriptional regulator AlpA
MLRLETPLGTLNADALTTLLGQVEALKFQILRRLAPEPAATPAPPEAANVVDIAEASKRIGMSKSWTYRNASKLSFARRVGNRLRFDVRGIEKFLDARQAS